MMIRLAVPNDASAIAAIHVACWHETYRGIIPDSYLDRLDTAERQRIWLKAIDNGQPVYAAVVDDRIIGFANGGKSRNTDTQYAGELYAIYLLKEFHKRGIGRKLFDSVVAQLSSQHQLPFFTWVLADNPALHFYQQAGGKVVGEQLENFDGSSLKELQIAWI
jgi:GNAT superfamily N-acetyltransferase